jgi:DNA (cytosine-5)-methyltransferase 1
MPGGDIVTPDIRDAERLQGFPENWTRPALAEVKPGWRWKLVGNAVSVPVAKWIGTQLARPARFDLGMVPNARPLKRRARWPDCAWNVAGSRETADVTAWPKHYRRKSLHQFLKHPGKPLSARATAGFLERTERSTLRFPPGFVETLCAHLARSG